MRAGVQGSRGTKNDGLVIRDVVLFVCFVSDICPRGGGKRVLKVSEHVSIFPRLSEVYQRKKSLGFLFGGASCLFRTSPLSHAQRQYLVVISATIKIKRVR